MADGDLDDFRDVVAEDAVNREDANEPPDSRVGGPAGFHATALWLRAAFADLAHRVEHVVVEDDLVVVDTVMTGRHVGPFVTYDAEGRVDTVWAPTHKTFAVRPEPLAARGGRPASPSTGPPVTTSDRDSSSGGFHPLPSTSCAAHGPSVELSEQPPPLPTRRSDESTTPNRCHRPAPGAELSADQVCGFLETETAEVDGMERPCRAPGSAGPRPRMFCPHVMAVSCR